MIFLQQMWAEFSRGWGKAGYGLFLLLIISLLCMTTLRAPEYGKHVVSQVDSQLLGQQASGELKALKPQQHYLLELVGVGHPECYLELLSPDDQVLRRYKVEENAAAEQFGVVYKTPASAVPSVRARLQVEGEGSPSIPALTLTVSELSKTYYVTRDAVYYVHLGSVLCFLVAGAALGCMGLRHSLQNGFSTPLQLIRRMTPALMFIGVFLQVATMIKSEFLYPDPDAKTVFNLREEFTDDSGFYITLFALNQGAGGSVEENWFQYQKENLNMDHLYDAWGRYAPRIMNVYSTTSRLNLVYNLNAWLGRLLNDNVKAYFVFVAAIPLLVLLKYGLLWKLFREQRREWIVGCVVVGDLLTAHELSFSMSFAWHVFTAGAALLFFSRKFGVGVGIVLLLIAGVSHLFCAALTVVLVAAGIAAYLYRRCGGVFDRRTTAVAWYGTIGLTALLLLFGALIAGYHYFIVDVGLRFFEYVKFWRGLMIYAAPVGLGLYGVSLWVMSGKRVLIPRVQTMMFIPFMLVGAIGAYCLIFAFTGNLEFGNNSWRLGYHMHWVCWMILCAVAALSYGSRMIKARRVKLLVVVVLVLVGLQYGGKVADRWAHWTPVANNTWRESPMEARDAAGNVVFYLATSPGHYFNYYVQEGYRMAPLVLDVNEGAYQKKEVIALLKQDGNLSSPFVVADSARSPLANRKWIRERLGRDRHE